MIKKVIGVFEYPYNWVDENNSLVIATATTNCITTTLLLVVAFLYFNYLCKHDNLSLKVSPTCLLAIRFLHFILFFKAFLNPPISY